MKNFLHKALVAFSLIFSGSLLISYIAPHISPEEFWLPAFWGLAYPYLLLANVIFSVYWMLRRRWSFLIPLIVILIGYGHLQDFVQINRSNKNKSESPSIKLMTYNVRAFDKYEWSKDKKTPNKMVELLKQNNADVYCFQEFYNTRNGLLSLYNLKKATACKYLFLSKKTNGVAIFSKYPIVQKGEIKFEKGNWCNAIYADIKKNGKIVRVYNLHLESNRLGGRNYAFINKKEFKADEEELNEIKDISFRLRHAFIRRAKQAEIIRGHVAKSPHPTIVCGDFNDTAQSYTYHKIKDGLIDCFREKGLGIGTTYSGDFPSFRIDFVLHDNKTVCHNYKRIKKKYSDHFPIITELNFVEK
ncbi:endonuclease/exonuclease/phosphatase family protein [Marinifilum fragile]|uniref:endonuclease/exonuclease/phosphatase family protein n=1 Tax=Marinifilum fragile TaxID=570161 RepID=UPI002AAB0E09|nr:endonuclease/exonuclease/phosphatase family protein [Marinifilum fragile]